MAGIVPVMVMDRFLMNRARNIFPDLPAFFFEKPLRIVRKFSGKS